MKRRTLILLSIVVLVSVGTLVAISWAGQKGLVGPRSATPRSVTPRFVAMADGSVERFSKISTGEGSTASPRAEDRFLGVVLANESVDILAEVDGRVQEVLVRAGDRVEAGERLAVLDNTALRHRLTVELGSLALIEAEVRSFAAQLEQTKSQLARRKSLAGLLSREDLETSEMLVKTSVYRFDVAKAEEVQGKARVRELKRQLAQAVVRAPFGGNIALRSLDPGALASRGTLIFRLVSIEATHLRFAVPPDKAERMVPGARLWVEVESLGRTVEATLQHQAPEIDAASEMVFVEALLEIPPDGGGRPLPAGSVARVGFVE